MYERINMTLEQVELDRAATHKAELQAILDEEELAQAKHEATLKRIKRQREERELEQQELEHELEELEHELEVKTVALNQLLMGVKL